MKQRERNSLLRWAEQSMLKGKHGSEYFGFSYELNQLIHAYLPLTSEHRPNLFASLHGQIHLLQMLMVAEQANYPIADVDANILKHIDSPRIQHALELEAEKAASSDQPIDLHEVTTLVSRALETVLTTYLTEFKENFFAFSTTRTTRRESVPADILAEQHYSTDVV
jgi:hypothetical protein